MVLVHGACTWCMSACTLLFCNLYSIQSRVTDLKFLFMLQVPFLERCFSAGSQITTEGEHRNTAKELARIPNPES